MPFMQYTRNFDKRNLTIVSDPAVNLLQSHHTLHMSLHYLVKYTVPFSLTVASKQPSFCATMYKNDTAVHLLMKFTFSKYYSWPTTQRECGTRDIKSLRSLPYDEFSNNSNFQWQMGATVEDRTTAMVNRETG